MVTIAANLILHTSSSSSTLTIDSTTRNSHVPHNKFNISYIPMQQQQQQYQQQQQQQHHQQPQQQQQHYYNNSTSNRDLGLSHVNELSNTTSVDANNLLYNHNQSFNCSQVMTNCSKNWSERILQDITGLLHVLSPNGKILYCSPSCIELTGFHPEELVGRSLTDFVHVDDLDLFIQNFQLAFSSLTRIKIHYRLRCRDNSFILLESVGHSKQDAINESTQYFFAIAQPYLSRSNGLMDSFLEIKLENEWLKKRLDEVLTMNHSPAISAVEPHCNNLQINTQQPQYQLEQQYSFFNNPYSSNDQHQQNYLQKQQQQQQQQIQINQSSRRQSNCTVMIDDQWNYSPSVASSSDMMNGFQTEESIVTGLSTATTTATKIATKSYLSSDSNLLIPSDVVRKDKWKRRVCCICMFIY